MSKRILVIDDEDGIRELVKIVLQASAGWEVLTAASGEEGLVAAEAEQPDAVLLDMRMPDFDGQATLGQLQANGATRRIPTILLTAAENPDPQQPLSDLEVAGLITKPFEAIRLAEQIREILHW
ncbi:MAG: response regulator [Pseudanabaenales cyanobacterium]|nr:response regulator [Pseudanabaenales cyanobacterium]